MVNSVQQKMQLMNINPSNKNNSVMTKRLGTNNNEIRYLGRSNQKIRRRLK